MCADDINCGRWPVLSIKQPWAELILAGRKDVEVRSWTVGYRGPLWIHTGQKIDAYAAERFQIGDAFRGGIVGYAVLDGIHPFSSSSWKAWAGRHLDDGAFNEELGKYGWILRRATRMGKAIPTKGSTGLFFLQAETLAQLRPQLRHPEPGGASGAPSAP